MVDRITPKTTEEDVRAVAEATGLADHAPVATEPFHEWVLSGSFPGGRPGWQHAGATFTDDITPTRTASCGCSTAAMRCWPTPGPPAATRPWPRRSPTTPAGNGSRSGGTRPPSPVGVGADATAGGEGPQRVGDVARIQAAGRDLVQQRLEGGVQVAVQQQHVDVGALERSHRRSSGEPAADHDDAGSPVAVVSHR
jgi:hypothetical protein